MTKDIHNPLNQCGRYDGMEEWDRWDEDLVEDFGHWLTLFGKAFAIVILLGTVLLLATWIYGLF